MIAKKKNESYVFFQTMCFVIRWKFNCLSCIYISSYCNWLDSGSYGFPRRGKFGRPPEIFMEYTINQTYGVNEDDFKDVRSRLMYDLFGKGILHVFYDYTPK